MKTIFPAVTLLALPLLAVADPCLGESPGLHDDLKIDRVVGVRILRLPKGDHSHSGVTTFVSTDPQHCQTIDDSLKRLPLKGPVYTTSNPIPKWDVIRKVVLINSDGREVSLTIYNDYLRGTFNNDGDAGKIISAIKNIERESIRELADIGPLPVIEAEVVRSDPSAFYSTGANVIRVGDRVTIDLAKLTKEKSSAADIYFTPSDEKQPNGWLVLPSALSCQRVNMTYRGKIKELGDRLMAQHYTVDAFVRIDVLVLGRTSGDIRYEITIIQQDNSFIRGSIRLRGKPATSEDTKSKATSK